MGAALRTIACTLTGALLASCSGSIVGTDEPAPAPGEGSPPAGGGGVPVEVGGAAPSVPGTPAGKTYAAFRPAPGTMHRLTTAQYANTIADVFGTDVRAVGPLEEDETSELFRSIGAAKVGTSAAGVERYQDAALAIAEQVVANRARYPWLAGCAPEAPSDPCVAKAIETIGLRLWRRPLGAEEVKRYAAIVGADGTGKDKVEAGLKHAIAGLLQSPQFLYLVTVGEDDPATGFRRFTGQELASRLAYFLWSSTPDPELLEAAGSGKLATRGGIEAEVARMIGKPRARSVASRFLLDLWNVSRLEEESKDRRVYPAWSAQLLGAYQRELEMTVEDVAFGRDVDVRELLDGRESYVNADLAKIYGISGASSAFARTALPTARSGLLTAGAVLAANSPAERSSPTQRGVFVLERILCTHVPPPPADANNAALPEPPKGQTRTVRERLEQHRADPACAGCHALFDPVGVAFEHFDGIGAYRSSDGGRPVDAAGSIDGRTLASARDLGTFLRGDARPLACLARHLYAFATGHEVTPGEEGLAEALGDLFAGAGGKLRPLLAGVAASNGFRTFAADR
jgi:hypothetical protein